MFFVDVIWKCRHFYFSPERWRTESDATARDHNPDNRSSPEDLMTHPRPKVYFAGPLFTQGERLWNEQMAAALASAGYEILLPQKQAETIVGSSGLTADVVTALFEKAVESINAADVIVAILDGPDADSGTCFECGYAFAREKPILGVRTDLRLGGDDPERGVNLMLSKSCNRLLRIGLESLHQKPDFVANKIIAGVQELLATRATTRPGA
jgi:nucleoside 2-deoxyribosyltransferase